MHAHMSPEVQPEGGPREDLDTVPHHAHLVQGGLAVEDDNVVVDDVPLHAVPKLQVEVADLWVVAKVDTVSIVSDDVLGSRVVVGTIVHQLLHPTGRGGEGRRRSNRCQRSDSGTGGTQHV